MRIQLRAGQTVFWNGNAIHRGSKPAGMGERLTLMSAMMDHSTDYEDGETGDQ